VTKAQHRALQAYVDTVKDRLGLRDWAIRVHEDEAPEGAMAFFWAATAQKVGLILVCEDFFEFGAREQRNAVAHELLHAHHAPNFHVIRDVVPELMSAKAYEPFRAHWEQTHEYAIDGVAKAIAQFLPMPRLG